MSYDFILTDDEKRELLRIARATLREHFHTGRIPPGKPHRDSLTDGAGAFVTLHKGGELRGCIGTQDESTAVFRTIQNMTVAAATQDPRFDAVTEDEIDDIEIEISVLGEIRPVTGASELQIGVHGLSIEHDGKRGLLLPQVAKENGWDAEAFLGRVCTKAGLAREAWREDGAKIHAFTAQVFSDATHPAMPLTFR